MRFNKSIDNSDNKMTENGDSGDSPTPNAPDNTYSQSCQLSITGKPSEQSDLSANSCQQQKKHFPVGSEENDIEILRKIEIRRKLNLSELNSEIRDSAVRKLIQVGATLYLSDEALGRAIKIFDFNLFQEPDLKEQLDLLIATSLLMAAKLEDVKRSDLCQSIRNNFDGFEESDILKFELKAFCNLNYDVIFSTAPQFLWYKLSKLSPQQYPDKDLISHYSRIICLCSQSSLKCCEYDGEEIASESIKIAIDMVRNGKKIEDFNEADGNEFQKHAIFAMQKLNDIIPSGIFNGLIQLPQEEISQ